ncbi:adenosylhomocysteinase, partial [Leucobacter soli]|uniref:adenosylhomocysteinase n=1 Tax=Leucobacter soli TaxID=2812850 RepID=UPI0036165B53
GSAASAAESRPGITSYRIGERDLHVLAGGALVNIAGGSGHPVEVMDLTFAVQGLGVHHLASTSLDPGVHILPKALDDSIAAAKLASYGIRLDELRTDQLDDHTARMAGTADGGSPA